MPTINNRRKASRLMEEGSGLRKLIDKLGILPGMTVMIEDPPDDFDKLLGPIPESVEIINDLSQPIDCLLSFVRTRQELDDHFDDLSASLTRAGMLWVCWLKQSSQMIVDRLLNEDYIRNLAISRDMLISKSVLLMKIGRD